MKLCLNGEIVRLHYNGKDVLYNNGAGENWEKKLCGKWDAFKKDLKMEKERY